MLPKDNLLKGAENRETLARILDKADQAIRTWEIALTDFLSPPELLEAEAIFARLTEVNCLAWGGYPQAERQRLAIARADIPLDASQVGVTALAIAGNFLFDSASHRDFLGSLLGTGLVRDKVGDIVLLGDRGAQAIVVPELADFLTASLVQVRSVKVKTQIMPLEDLRVRPPKVKELTTVEASMRLDAIASAGFGMSRSKMVDLINAGDVRVNWKPVSQASHPIATNDLIAIRGKGRLTIGEVMITKKQRYRINLKRFI
ncbi:MAG: photosystem II S4 domain protein [Synechococcales cyanobacterium RM1_1_8]|nr:photosystem II S4 domain protein [Synechococcales cyanobacterium RM1_1_8]